MSHLKNFVRDESGATSMEYAFIAALIGLAIVGGLTTLGTSVDSAFQGFATHLSTNTP
ncbi:MAG: Flp family type IVb pilin [Kiloniellales bacterium]|nr:Flp family type IVb pilin [Kiloniellales bacterium]